MALNSKLGIAASTLITLGSFFYSKLGAGVTPFSFYPKIIGLGLCVIGGIFWLLDSLWNGEREPAFMPSLNWGLGAGSLTSLAGGIAIIGLYFATGPLFWVAAGLSAVSAACWLKASEGVTLFKRTNQFAAALQGISVVAQVAAEFIFPGALRLTSLIIGIFSPAVWLGSYALTQEPPIEPQPVATLPAPRPIPQLAEPQSKLGLLSFRWLASLCGPEKMSESGADIKNTW